MPGGGQLQPYQVYVNYMLSVYFAPDSDQKELSAVEMENCAVCDRTLRKMSDEDRTVIKAVFSREKAGVAHGVEDYAEKTGTALKDVWRAIRTVSKEIAREKKLI